MRGHVAGMGHPVHAGPVVKLDRALERGREPAVISGKPGACPHGSGQGLNMSRVDLVIVDDGYHQIKALRIPNLMPENAGLRPRQRVAMAGL